jgi:hypothetical protein
MGIGVFGTVTKLSRCHPRDGLVGDPVISDMDSVQYTEGLSKLKNISAPCFIWRV